MKKVNLEVEGRIQSGTAEVERLRKSGFVPGVVYGDNKENLLVQLDSKKLIHFLHKIGEENVLTNLKIKNDGKVTEQLVIIKDMQYDPVTEKLVHMDFQRVSLKKKIISEVHIVLKGEPEGVKVGGILDQALRAVEVECLPQDMPEHIEVDISGLNIHDSVHVRDLPLPPGAEMVTDEERTVLSILPPRKIEVEEEAPAEIEEPELIGEEGEEGKEETPEEGEGKEAKPQEGRKKEEAAEKKEDASKEPKKEEKKE